jgi:hypothetical protein
MRQFSFETIPLDRIDPDIPFLLSWGYDPAPLMESIRRVGQTQPVILWPQDGRLMLLAGIRRWRALAALGRETLTALVPSDPLPPREAFALAIEDNQRPLNDAEKALAIGHAGRLYGEAAIIADVLPRLGIPGRKEYLGRYQSLTTLGPAGLDALADGRLDPETGQRLAALAESERNAVWSLFDALSPGRNKRREILTLLDEIGWRDGLSPSRVLADERIQDLLATGTHGRPQKEALVRSRLKAMRRPEWTRLLDRRAELEKALKLPPNLRLEADPNFEGLDMKIITSFSDPDEFRKAREALRRILDDPALDEWVNLG